MRQTQDTKGKQNVYNVVIADDEDNIRNGLINFVNWQSFGLRVVANFEDGEELIDYIGKNHVDIIITDIRMSVTSGLDVAEYVHNNKLNCKVILLSGYKEFEYAKKAIAYNVSEYLLKPVEVDVLYSILQKLRKQLDQDAALKEQQKKISQLKRQQLQHIFNDCFSADALNVSDQVNRLALLDHRIDVKQSPLAAFVINISSPGNEKSLSFVKESLETEAEGGSEFFLAASTNEALICFALGTAGNGTADLLSDISSFVTRMQNGIFAMLGISCDYEIKNLFRNLSELDSIKLRCSFEGYFRESGPGKIQYQQHIINEAREYIDENYAQDISLDDAAATVFLSPVYFSRLFKEVTGKSFIKYLTAVRIGKAIELLDTTHYRANEIGMMVGYKTISYFSKIFKKQTGYTPSEYRHANENKKN